MGKYINNLQLRAARGVLNLGVRDVGSIIGVSRMTISKLEHNTTTLERIKHGESRNNTLIWFFKKMNIVFPDSYTISYCSIINENHVNTINEITRFQLKAARIIIDEDRIVFSNALGIERGVLEYAESLSNEEYIKPRDSSINQKIKDRFNNYGVNFLNNNSVTFKKLVDVF